MKEFLKEKTNVIHLIIILLGSIFVLIPAFHTNLWFDESYSVAMATNHNLFEIWSIGGHDVHPILYYWMLKFVNIIFGNNILAYRLFSIIPVFILGVLGLTHIKKDFGAKVGLLFTFFSFFLPTIVVYASEIRMYTWVMLFVSVMAIYAYRIYKNKNEKTIKNWIIFAIFSLASAYTHYYGLMAAGIVNLILFIYCIIQSRKAKKINKNMICFIVSALIQIVLYVPWLIYFALQLSQVSKGFWIGVKFPDTLIEMFTFQFTGNLIDSINIDNIYAIIYGLIVCIYLLYILRKKNRKEKSEDMKPAKLSIVIYGLVILASAIISIVIMQPIIYARYFLAITGLFIFSISYVMVKLGNKKLNAGICILTVLVATCININMIKYNYDESNKKPIEYLKENIQESDIFIYGNEGSGFVVSANFPNNTQYFWDQAHWNVEQAYKAYGPSMKTVYNLDDIKDYKGRIWIVNGSNYAILEHVQDEYDVKVIEKERFSVEYKKYQYTFALVEKY